jgi:hypothetical protein
MLCHRYSTPFKEDNTILQFGFLLQVGERIRVILDCEDNTLSFERNYEFLGVAFKGKYVI